MLTDLQKFIPAIKTGQLRLIDARPYSMYTYLVNFSENDTYILLKQKSRSK